MRLYDVNPLFETPLPSQYDAAMKRLGGNKQQATPEQKAGPQKPAQPTGPQQTLKRFEQWLANATPEEIRQASSKIFQALG